MDFYLNIGTITKGINDYNGKYNILEEQKANISSTINWLVGIGWSGSAKDKFLEAFQAKMKLYEKLQEDIQYMINALEQEKQRALPLKTRCEDYVNCIERSGQGGAITGDDEGVISLDYSSQSPINNYVNNCTNEDYVKLSSNFNNIENILNELEYTSFGISGEIDSAKTSVKDQTESLTEFDNSYNAYYTGVKDMESNICSVFSKISGVNGGLFKDSSIISPSGDIDKNKLRDAILKNGDGLTEDDKSLLNYIERIMGNDDYNNLKGIMVKNPENLTYSEKQMLEQVKNVYAYGNVSKDTTVDAEALKNHVSYIFYQPGVVSGDGKHHFDDEANIEKGKLESQYPGTNVVLMSVNNPKEFKDAWNSMDDRSMTIDGVQIILHGTIDNDDGESTGTGFLYFENEEMDEKPEYTYRIAAGDSMVRDNDKDINIHSLDNKKMDYLYFSSCNSGNPDANNTGNAFNDIVDANEIVAWDGGTIYDYDKNEEFEGGEGNIKEGILKMDEYGTQVITVTTDEQPTWYKYVPRDSNGSAARNREGKVWIKSRE